VRLGRCPEPLQTYASFLAFLDGMVAARFLRPTDRARVLVGTDPAALLGQCVAYTPPPAHTWLTSRES